VMKAKSSYSPRPNSIPCDIIYEWDKMSYSQTKHERVYLIDRLNEIV
jgi:hypothetical protein